MIKSTFNPIQVAKGVHLEDKSLDGRKRKNIKEGIHVQIVQKEDQATGELTDGFVYRILTKTANHPHGIKVQLEGGEVGRVKKIILPT